MPCLRESYPPDCARAETGGLTMAEYIEREALLDSICHETCGIAFCGATNCAFMAKVSSAPAADVAPVVHGRWISFLDGDHIMPERYYRCSRCGRVESRWQPYCHCGAKMDGGADHEAD